MIKQFGQLCLAITLLATASIFAGCKNGVCSLRSKPAPVVVVQKAPAAVVVVRAQAKRVPLKKNVRKKSACKRAVCYKKCQRRK